MRLQKFISNNMVYSRREAEKLIENGFVELNGKVVNKMGICINPDEDKVIIKKEEVEQKYQKTTIALWKPVGYITSTKKNENCKIIIDLLPKELKNLYPAGRLDKESSGLIILTNDGNIAYKITHPSFNHKKTYNVVTNNQVTNKDIKHLESGNMKILGKTIKKNKIIKIKNKFIKVILSEGKNRQIRRMLRNINNGVKKLQRVAIGSLELSKLKISEGQYKILNEEEIKLLFNND